MTLKELYNIVQEAMEHCVPENSKVVVKEGPEEHYLYWAEYDNNHLYFAI